MIYLKGLVIALLLVLGQVATADITTITAAHEVFLSNFRAPASENGSVSFKVCEECEIKVVSVDANTRYVLNRQTVSLSDFRKSLTTVRRREDETVIVMHHLKSDRITSVSITL